MEEGGERPLWRKYTYFHRRGGEGLPEVIFIAPPPLHTHVGISPTAQPLDG